MPGPGRAFGSALADAVQDGRVDEGDLDAARASTARRVRPIGALDGPPPTMTREHTDPDDRALLRRAAAERRVLLRNDGILPLAAASLRRVAVIGPHAADRVPRGRRVGPGDPAHRSRPLDALALRVRRRRSQSSTNGAATRTGRHPVGRPGAARTRRFRGGRVRRPRADRRGAPRSTWTELRGLRRQRRGSGGAPTAPGRCGPRGPSCPRRAACSSSRWPRPAGPASSLDGELVLDGVTNPPRPAAPTSSGMASQDLLRPSARRPGRADSARRGVRLGDESLRGFPGRASARSTATTDRAGGDGGRGADVAVVVVGTTEEWETEGATARPSSLPGRQDRAHREGRPRPTPAPSSSSTPARRWTCHGRTAWPPFCSARSEERRWPRRWPTCDGARGAGRPVARRPSRCESSTTRRTTTSRARTASCVTAKVCSWAIAATSTGASRPASPSATASSYTTFEIGEPSLSAADCSDRATRSPSRWR